MLHFNRPPPVRLKNKNPFPARRAASAIARSHNSFQAECFIHPARRPSDFKTKTISSSVAPPNYHPFS
jgi:hypothetical protein